MALHGALVIELLLLMPCRVRFISHLCPCLQAVLSGGKVYTVDRLDVTDSSLLPPLAPVTMPSLMWTEIQVTVSGSLAAHHVRQYTRQ